MKKFTLKSFVVVSVMFGALSGCAMMGTEGHSKTVSTLMDEQVQSIVQLSNNGYSYAVGSSPHSQKEALSDAIRQLGQSVFVQVRSEMAHILSQEIAGDSEDNHSSFESSTSILSDVEIEGAETVDRVQGKDGWVVTVRASKQVLEELRTTYKKNAATISYIEQISQVVANQPAQRLILSLKGLAQAREDQILNDRIGLGIGNRSYGSYFEQIMNSSIGQMQLLPELNDGDLHFTLIDTKSLTPQQNIAIAVEAFNLITGRDGSTHSIDFDALPARFSPLIIGDYDAVGRSGVAPETLQIETFNPSDWGDEGASEIYIHTIPAGLVIEVEGRSYESPARISTSTHGRVDLTIHATKETRAASLTLYPGKTPAIYRSKKLDARYFGKVNLSLDSGRGIEAGSFVLRSSQGEEIYQGPSPLNTELEIGSYSVEVYNPVDQENYQNVSDQFVLGKGATISRKYLPPIDREAFAYGSFNELEYGAYKSGLGSDYLIPVGEKAVRYADLSAGVAGVVGPYDFRSYTSIGYQHGEMFDFLNLMYRFEFSGGTYQFNHQGTDQMLKVRRGSLGAGFWTDKIADAGWISASMNLDVAEWEGGSKLSGKLKQSYPQLDLGVNSGIFVMRISVPDPDYGKPAVFLGVGITKIKKGFHFESDVKAISGQHYH